MSEVGDASVALMVTSPPYFAGKEYEEAMGEGHVPGTYVEYLGLLEHVFAESVRKLEPGGRVAVNVANLGRKPYRSLSSDVVMILQDRLGLLLRGEIIWIKAKGAAGSCAWGSFQSPANPVLRDLTERVLVASKGRFDRAISRRQRASRQIPSEVSISKDEFMESTTDLWEISPESAKRVGHPAPFPVELPERLIHLYTYIDDLVLDPFMGSGSTAVAAVRTNRRFIGYEMEPQYIRIADERIDRERHREPAQIASEGKSAKEIARIILEKAGFADIRENQRVSGGMRVDFDAKDQVGGRWLFEVAGTVTSGSSGLRKSETLWKALGKAAVLASSESKDYQLVILTTDLPSAGTAGESALSAVVGTVVTDAVEMMTPQARERLRNWAKRGSPRLLRRVGVPVR